MQRLFIAIIILQFFTSCDLLRWDLEKFEYENFEINSPGTVGQLHKHTTNVLVSNEEYSWSGISSGASGLIVYNKVDSSFHFNGLLSDYKSNFLYSDSAGTIHVFNNDEAILVQRRSNTGIVTHEQSQLVPFVKMNLGLLEKLVINDIVTFQGNYLLAGEVKQTIGNSRAILILLTADLQPIWLRTYISNSFASDIVVSNEGLIYMAGIRNGHSYIIRTNMDGNEFQIRDFDILGRDSLADMIYSKNAIIFTSSYNQYPYKTRIVMFDTNLKERWWRDMPQEYSKSSIINSNLNGNLSLSYFASGNVYLTELRSENGESVWCNQFEKDLEYYPRGIIQTVDNGFFIISESTMGELNVIKTDEEGATRKHPFSATCF